jgi:hypothetical protein
VVEGVPNVKRNIGVATILSLTGHPPIEKKPGEEVAADPGDEHKGKFHMKGHKRVAQA